MAEFASLPLFTDAISSDCAHLSNEEFGIYMRLLILMWRTPGASVPDDDGWIARKMRMPVQEWLEKGRPIVDEFCICYADALHEHRISQKRLLKEFEHVRTSVAKRKAAAAKRWAIENTKQSDVQSISNADAPTPTPTPTPSVNKKKAPAEPKKKSPTPREELSRVLDPQRTQAVLDHRQRIKKPLTSYAANLLAKQLELTPDPNGAADHMIGNGWQGFKPEWMNRSSAPQAPPRESAHQTRQREARESFARAANGDFGHEPSDHHGPNIDLERSDFGAQHATRPRIR